MVSDTKKTLLLVEDEAVLAMSTERNLKKYGYNALVVNTGEKAVDICKGNINIDLILMDIDLGSGIDGTKAAELILEEREIPVLFLSSHTEPEIVDKTEKITSYGYVVKSSSITVLIASIKMAFKLFLAHDHITINEEKFSKAFFNHPAAMQILNIKTGQRVEMNESCIKLFGIEKKEFLKGNIYTNNISADPLKRQKIIDDLVERKKITNIPFDIISTTGEIKNLLASGSILNIDNGELGIFSYIDITDSKKADLELIKSEGKYRRLVENLSDDYFFYTHDTAGIMTYISPSVTSMLGYSKKDFMDHYSKYFTDSPINDIAIKHTKKSIEGMKQRPYLVEVYHKDGSIRIQEISETPVFDAKGKVISVEGLAHDITEIKKAENEVKHQLAEKEIILKEVHHRIKNNFTSIGSLLSLQIQKTTNPEAISALQDAIGRVRSMQVLYEKLLITEDYHVTSVKEYLNNLIDDILNLFSEAIYITVKKNLDDFQLDPKLLVPVGIIVNEILTNVMKYAFTGRESGLIEITVKEISGNVTLTIQDNGIGLPKEFDLHQQTSFGLMLVRILSEQLGGTFTIQNNNGTLSILKFNINSP